MKYIYSTNNQVCAQSIELDVENNIIAAVKFNGGCQGNHRGIAKLVEGMKIDDVIQRLTGVTCGMRNTSCPDQLACALKQIKKESQEI